MSGVTNPREVDSAPPGATGGRGVENGVVTPEAGPVRIAKPAWWWFSLHGALAIAFGAFTLLTPSGNAAGFLLDGRTFATLMLLSGPLIILQAVGARGTSGWQMFLVIGIHALLAGVALWIIASLGLAAALYWSVLSFFIVEGLLLVIGLWRSPVFRLWGALMGACMITSSTIMTVAWLADPDHSYDIPSTGLGISCLFYGVAILVAAILSRSAALRAAPERSG
jgi:uncharacterized membrane protein HdeD (DUF308 family)